MGEIHVVLRDTLENNLSKAAGVKFGGRRGAITKALNEAVSDWVEKNKSSSH